MVRKKIIVANQNFHTLLGVSKGDLQRIYLAHFVNVTARGAFLSHLAAIDRINTPVSRGLPLLSRDPAALSQASLVAFRGSERSEQPAKICWILRNMTATTAGC